MKIFLSFDQAKTSQLDKQYTCFGQRRVHGSLRPQRKTNCSGRENCHTMKMSEPRGYC
jgi:hypothetical protein